MSLTGKSTTEQKIDPALAQFARDVLGRSTAASQVGYVPYQGNTVAGFTPNQEASMMNTGRAANSFGTPSPFAQSTYNTVTGENLPQSVQGQAFAASGRSPFTGMTTNATADANGAVGYSSYGGYQDALSKIPQGQMDAIKSFFIDPETGALPDFMQGLIEQPQQPPASVGGGGGGYRPQPPSRPSPPQLISGPAIPNIERPVQRPPNFGAGTGTANNETFISGGGADGYGRFGKVGDYFGGIGDAIGITNYDGRA